jgi:hypothetical protein
MSDKYFDVSGIQPQSGRVFHAAGEHSPNSAPDIMHIGAAVF